MDKVMALTVTISTIILVFAVLVILHQKQVHGDDNENDLGLCERGYKDHCTNETLRHDLEGALMGALMIWNSANCSVRDICTPAKLCCVAPQIQRCEPDDETYNITSFCDPDDQDTGNETDK